MKYQVRFCTKKHDIAQEGSWLLIVYERQSFSAKKICCLVEFGSASLHVCLSTSIGFFSSDTFQR